jgi:fatty acid CoA ligase FadD36
VSGGLDLGDEGHAQRSGADAGDALSFPEGCASREELADAAGSLVGRLAGASAVAVWATPSLATVVGAVGCLAAGVPFIPLAPDSGPIELDHVFRDSGVALILGAPEEVELPAGVERVPAEAVWPGPGVGDGIGIGVGDRDPSSVAMIVYTSGTTGPPKGVVLSRGAIAADLDALAEAWDWTPDDVLVHGLPLFHVHGLVLGTLGALRVGCKLVHTGRPTPEAYAAAGGSLYFGVPTVWSRVCAEPSAADALRKARLLVSGSAPLPVPIFERLVGLTGHRPVERYGMSETLITLSTRSGGERRLGSVGTPLLGVETRVLDDDGGPVPADGESLGELQVRGTTLFDGYLGRPDETARSYTDDGWFRTADIATVEPDGFHRIVGRRSTDLIKSGGYRVGAGEVEAALLSHHGVTEAAVIGVPDDDLGQAIVAFVVADSADAAELSRFVAERLAIHKRPRRVHVVDSLPRNALGKVQKAFLSE